MSPCQVVAKDEVAWPVVATEVNSQDLVPGHSKVLQLKILIIARPEKSKDLQSKHLNH